MRQPATGTPPRKPSCVGLYGGLTHGITPCRGRRGRTGPCLEISLKVRTSWKGFLCPWILWRFLCERGLCTHDAEDTIRSMNCFLRSVISRKQCSQKQPEPLVMTSVPSLQRIYLSLGNNPTLTPLDGGSRAPKFLDRTGSTSSRSEESSVCPPPKLLQMLRVLTPWKEEGLRCLQKMRP